MEKYLQQLYTEFQNIASATTTKYNRGIITISEKLNIEEDARQDFITKAGEHCFNVMIDKK